MPTCSKLAYTKIIINLNLNFQWWMLLMRKSLNFKK